MGIARILVTYDIPFAQYICPNSDIMTSWKVLITGITQPLTLQRAAYTLNK